MSCTCGSFHRSYICKHILKVSDIFSFPIPGYKKVHLLATNATRGPKKGKKRKCLDDNSNNRSE